MSLIARIQFVNFLTYSNPSSKTRKPALRVIEFAPLKYSAAINIPNGCGKTNMVSVLLFLLSRDKKLRAKALSLFNPRRCGSPSHIRIQLWDLQDNLIQDKLELDQGLLDPQNLPNNNNHHVFGLCAYEGDEPRFYYYKGTLEDCPVYTRTQTGYQYHQESQIKQVVKDAGGIWNISSKHEWRSLVTSHIPNRVLNQQVKFHLDGGGDKSAQLHKIEPDFDESFDQAFFRSVIAPELLVSTSDLDSDSDDVRENFEELLYAHFNNMASAKVATVKDQQEITELTQVVHDLNSLVSIGEKATEAHDNHLNLLEEIARDAAIVNHLVKTDPFPGLLDGRKLPPGLVGEIVPSIVIDKVHGAMILDAGIKKLVNVEVKRINQAANRNRISIHELDQSQVIDFTCDLKIFDSHRQGGIRIPHKSYLLHEAIELIPLLSEINNAKTDGTEEILREAFAWVENTADTNLYRKQAKQIDTEIEHIQENIKQRIIEIEQYDGEIKNLENSIKNYDQNKGAYQELVKSGKFSTEELRAPKLLSDKTSDELTEADDNLKRHITRTANLESLYKKYLKHSDNHPGLSVRTHLEELKSKANEANEKLRDAKDHLQSSEKELARLNDLKDDQDKKINQDQKKLDELLNLQSHQSTYKEWFKDTPPDSIDISGGLKKITAQEKALEKKRLAAKKILDGIQETKPFVDTFHNIFDSDTDPYKLDPINDRAIIEKKISTLEIEIQSFEIQVSKLSSFRQKYPDITPSVWLKNMETERTLLSKEIDQYNQKINIAKRQLAELMSDPVARPEDIANAHKLIDETVPYITLHAFIEKHCPSDVKKHWLTHFSALLFSPVVETIDEASKAARLLHDGQAMMPVLIGEKLKNLINNETPTLTNDDKFAYTWLMGFNTNMVQCLLNPSTLENEKVIAQQRIKELEENLKLTQKKLSFLEDRSENVQLARDAAKAEDGKAEYYLATNKKSLKQLEDKLPDILNRCSNEALESIQNTKNYLEILKEHGNDIFERLISELSKISEELEILCHDRKWYEDRNGDQQREAISAMRSFQRLGGEKEIANLCEMIQSKNAALESILEDITTATDAAKENTDQLEAAERNAATATTVYDENKSNLEELVEFAEGGDLIFMETSKEALSSLETKKSIAFTRTNFKSQFIPAQCYIDNLDLQINEHESLKKKAELEEELDNAKKLQRTDSETVDEKRKELKTIKILSDALHDSACSILAEFRAVSKSLDGVNTALNEKMLRFEHTDLYKHTNSLRDHLEKIEINLSLIEDIRKIGQFARELGLASQSKEIASSQRSSEKLAHKYRENTNNFCTEIIEGKKKGLSTINAEWLKSQDRFDAPLEKKIEIESIIQDKHEVLHKAEQSLDFARTKTTEMLTLLAKDAQRALDILEESMATTPKARFHINAKVISPDKINNLMDQLYFKIEGEALRLADQEHNTPISTANDRRQKKRDLDYLRTEIYRSLFSDVSVEFKHPSIWQGSQHKLTADGLSEGMKAAISLMWIAKLAEFRLRQAVDQYGGRSRQNRKAMRKERYFMILDGLFSNLSHDEMIDSAMESLSLSSGHFQLIGMIHHPRYINNPKIFPAYFVGRRFSAQGSKHSWLSTNSNQECPSSLGVFSSHFTSTQG